MRKTTVLIVVVLLAGVAGAQNMMPIPGFGSTFSSASLTRGFYFQAPIDFTIVGMRVPDETKHGKQNVAIIKPAAQPPTYPTTATGGLQFYKGGEPSSIVIPCQVAFKKGEWVAVLGACGDATIMHNSYSTSSSPFQSKILGQTVPISRFGTQTNIVTQQGKGAYWCNTGTVSRVEVYVASATLAGSGSGSPGTPLDFTLKSAADAGLPYQMGSSFGNGPIPIDTRKLELSPDDFLVLSTSGVVPMICQGYAGLLDTQGSARARLDIPNIPALKGIRIYTAFVTLKATAPSGVSSISNSFMFTIT